MFHIKEKICHVKSVYILSVIALFYVLAIPKPSLAQTENKQTTTLGYYTGDKVPGILEMKSK